jgi:hypothetical protein
MAYFLKKSKNNKGVYLQIYESFYDPDRRQTAHRSARALGYVHELEEDGIADPVAHFRTEVDAMNAKRRRERDLERTRRIGDASPERLLGYLPFKAINDSLDARRDLDLLQLPGNFRFSLYDMVASLVYARVCAPCSKRKTFHDVLPLLFEKRAFSLDQLYEGLSYIGAEYEKIVEIYNAHLARRWPRATSVTYFDATNFFFEIDREDELRRKGPSKENRHEPIVSLGLLLDRDCIPLGMRVFAGNESEKPVLREVVASLKRRSNITGKTVRVADKGLNCADNIVSAILEKDGYIFSKSVRQLEGKERIWALGEEGYSDILDPGGRLIYRMKECTDGFSYNVRTGDGKRRKVELEEKRVVTFNPKLAKKQLFEIGRQVEKAQRLRLAAAKRSEYGDSARYVTFATVDANGEEAGTRVVATLNHDAIKKARQCAGYNMIVTSETSMSAQEIYTTYHNLWRIEESFRVMKSELCTRPVYVQKTDSITGHFLICYLAVLLLRCLQFKVLDQRFCSEDIMGFAKNFRAVKVSERRYVNISRFTPLIDKLEELTGLPLGNYYLGKGDIDRMVNCRL